MERVWLLSLVMAMVLLLAHGAVLAAMLSILGQIEMKTTSSARVLMTNEGPDIHTRFPELSGRDLEGNVLELASPGREQVVVLLSAGCGPCEQLLRALGAAHRNPIRPVQLTAVFEATPQEARRYQRRFRLKFPVLVDEKGAIREQLGVQRTPYGFLIDQDRVVRMKGVVNDRGQLEGLISRRGRDFAGLNWDTLQTLEATSSQA